MGLFDGIAKGLGEILGGGEQKNSLVELATNLISGAGGGGLSDLAGQFKEKGLGDILSSWVGTGENQPITAEQIQNVLGNEKIQEAAEKLGFSGEDVSKGLATLLPGIIDALTPNGTLPDEGTLDRQMPDLLKIS